MKFNKRQLVFLIIVVIASYFLVAYKLPYYIYKPGGADALNPIVQVEHGFESEGDMHLVTVRGGQATPIQYLLAKFNKHQEILPLDEVFPEGITEDEYFHAQLQVMENSQEAATVVAYEAAEKDITIDYEGVYIVSVVENMPAEGQLEVGDEIINIDNNKIEQTDDLMDYIETKRAGDKVNLTIIRDDEELTKEVSLKEFDDIDNRIGMGVSLVTDRSVTVNPKVNFSSGNIGGPSAGLMFSLEIYDQLTEQDLTHGYEIAGTGEVDYNANVIRIGGIDKKVIAADREGCDIFFAPHEGGAEDSNYNLAKQTADEIGTDMEIVPVDTFEDALNYLHSLD
ncbi:PDZ domain-containing protein [Virgibacillus sp. MSJ-26]|uniref:SepM family pheromone-processing serine protease n=1 Tax=Virgibacillus sp. MSJ-26 TaxID=2841522 RepID=UPI001C10B6BF|nr:SepM family pheromone-processing serine protease [Virgibacillus sp. MSJ-26]MBU5467753.1 PDZ domain-containing protein [Virgibacillus sp. MSJ-26]